MPTARDVARQDTPAPIAGERPLGHSTTLYEPKAFLVCATTPYSLNMDSGWTYARDDCGFSPPPPA